MKKKGLLLVVALLALSGLMAAMAYTTANVKQSMTLDVVNTTKALLALEAGTHGAASYADTDHQGKQIASKLSINLNRGNGGVNYGLQRDSKYIWDDLFKVTNNSEKTVTVTVDIKRDKGPYIYLKTGSSWANGPKITFDLAPGDFKWVDMEVHTVHELRVAPTNYNFDLVVSAVAK